MKKELKSCLFRGVLIGFIISLLLSILSVYYSCDPLDFFVGAFSGPCKYIMSIRDFIPWLSIFGIALAFIVVYPLMWIGQIIGINDLSSFALMKEVVFNLIIFSSSFVILGLVLGFLYWKIRYKTKYRS